MPTSFLYTRLKERYPEYARIYRFIISGGTGMVVNLIVLYTLTEFAGIWYLYSTTLGWILGVLASFILQKSWTFEDSSADVAARQATKYFALQGLDALLNAGGMYLLVSVLGVWYILAQILLGALIAVWAYFILQRFIFRAPSIG